MDTFTLELAEQTLKKFWGYPSLRPAQRDALSLIATGKDTLAILPTSAGKTAVFQIPAILAPHPSIVISPLIALMKDQVDDALSRGVPAACINSHTSTEDAKETLDDFLSGKYVMLYVAPERLKNRAFADALAEATISYLIVDEAHSVSMFGHAFRPAYLQIHKFVERLDPRPQLIGVTATLTRDDDVAARLGMQPDCLRIVTDPTRPNIEYAVKPIGEKASSFTEIARLVESFNYKTDKHIIYCGTRKGAEIVADIAAEVIGCKETGTSRWSLRDNPSEKRAMQKVGAKYVGFYHAGMGRDDTVVDEDNARRVVAGRTAIQDDFKSGSLSIVVATNAFGMGIDVPNIRTIIHMGIPGSLEAYVQETGRAGRDGLPSRAILLHDPFSIQMRRRFLEVENPPPEDFDKVWEWIEDTAETGEIIRKTAEQIAHESKIEGRDAGSIVNTILNVFSRVGLIHRVASPESRVLSLNPKALRSYLEDDNSNAAQSVATFLQVRVLATLPPDEIRGNIELAVSVEDIAESVGVSESTVQRVLRELLDSDVVVGSSTFRGKLTQVLRTRVDLKDVLPYEELIAKRERDEARLMAMMQYTQARDHREYIRQHFMGDAL